MNLAAKPLVSVVTPVYNGEKFLSECIESVITQTYENWEYVIVNNCSTDRSFEIAQHYAEKDSRIRIHNNKKHLTIFANWNHALRQISTESKYCKVVHADDWLFKECLKKMVEVAESNTNIGIVGSYRLEDTKVTGDGLPYPSTVVSGRDICRSSLLKGLYVFGTPTTLLIRSDLIRTRKCFYNESNIHCDNEICYEILQNCDFGFVHQVLSFSRMHVQANTTYYARLGTFVADHLFILKKYGLVYLSDQEFKKNLKKKFKNYYRKLAKILVKSITRRNAKEVWSYQNNKLKEIGYQISSIKLLMSFLIVSFNRLQKRITKID